jgi:hypothetical protein
LDVIAAPGQLNRYVASQLKAVSMIDSRSGEVLIESIPVRLGPAFTRDALSSLPISCQSQVVNEPYHSYSLGRHRIGGEPFLVMLYFYGQKLESIELANSSEEFGTSWDDWSEAKQLKRKQAHDAWLIAQTNRASHRYDWGEIASGHDPKSGESSITIRYSWQGEPWSHSRAT